MNVLPLPVMMGRKYRIMLFLAFVLTQTSHGQTTGALFVRGKVVDSVSSAPLALATIYVYRTSDKKLAKENFSDSAGYFSVDLPGGSYYAEIEFAGYRSQVTSPFHLTKEKPLFDAGTLRLSPDAGLLGEVVVRAEKSAMTLALDKRIFNVGKDLANAGGSALDILSNVPSVVVDPEGSVKLRGSDNVRILIDGKPSGLVSLKGGSGLQQLQAGLVDRVEIITNPSARYEAEGMAGIINIVLKKERKKGFNGSVELIAGAPLNLGMAANFNYRHKRVNFFINYGIAYSDLPRWGKMYQELYRNDSTFILKQSTDGHIVGFNTNIRGGLDYFFSETSTLTAAYLYRRSRVNRLTDNWYEDYVNRSTTAAQLSKRTQDEQETEPNSEYTVNYKKEFGGKGHELQAEIKYIDNWEHSDQIFTHDYFNSFQQPAYKSILQKSLNDEYERHWLVQGDYLRPIGKDGKFETGLRSSFRNMKNDYLVTERDASGVYHPLPGLDNLFLYRENIHGAYVILGNKRNRISYQGGLRAEMTDVETILQKTAEIRPRRYTNLFPSAHFNYSLRRENALQISYSKRVRRPFYNDLSPFMTYVDSRNYYSGNPNLNPEFSNAFELAHLKTFAKGAITSSLYYRQTKDKIYGIRRVNQAGNSVTLPENLLGEQAYGIEWIGNYGLFKWWKQDFNFNFFHSAIDGSNISQAYKTSSYSWFVRQTARFSFRKDLEAQLRGSYEAPQKTAQGRRKGLYYADFSASKDVWNQKATFTLAVTDLFNSRKMRSVSRGENFYTDNESQGRRRQLNLSFTYRINQAKTAGRSRKTDGGEAD